MPRKKLIPVYITIEGGIIQSIESALPLCVTIIDFDTDDIGEADITVHPDTEDCAMISQEESTPVTNPGVYAGWLRAWHSTDAPTG